MTHEISEVSQSTKRAGRRPVMTWLSRRFIVETKLSPVSQAKLARCVGISPEMFCRYIRHAKRVRAGNLQIVQIGKLLGLLPDECFEPVGIPLVSADHFAAGSQAA